MTTEVEIRDLEKLQRTISWAWTHHKRRDESNACLHMNEKTLYSNLTNDLERALLLIGRYLTEKDPAHDPSL